MTATDMTAADLAAADLTAASMSPEAEGDTANTPVIVCGVTGRMGLLLAGAAQNAADFSLVGATVRSGGYAEGDDVGELVASAPVGVKICSDLAAACSDFAQAAPAKTPVVIDFTSPSALDQHLAICLDRGLPFLVGTTGLSPDHLVRLRDAAQTIPVLVAPNTSLGANLLAALTQTAARALPGADLEIVELHHREKKDSPSGTAILLGQAAAGARGQEWDAVATFARAGESPRRPGKIGCFGVRGGTVVGEHTVHLFLDDERLELAHKVQDRRVFAHGALAAARFLGGEEAGLFSMQDVLGLGGL